MSTRSLGFWPRSSFSAAIAPSLLLAGLLLLTAPGCGDDEEACSHSDECSDDQACVGGQCIDRSTGQCDSRDDCERGEVCEGGLCTTEPADMSDAEADASDAAPDIVRDVPTETDVTDTTVDRPPDQVFDDPPLVASTNPAAYATGIPINATVSITFDQPMVSTSLSPNVRIEDYAGAILNRAVAYNAETWTVTLTPTAPQHYFGYAAPYTVIVEDNVSGSNGMYMENEFEFTFSTANFSGMDTYATLAQAYAPVIYAEVRPGTTSNPSHRLDWFTRFDFDGNMIAGDNQAHAAPANRVLVPHVYYNVLETKTHYLIQYVLYYPMGVNDRNDEGSDAVEHDFTMSLVVVQKVSTDTLGRFVMAQGLGDAQIWSFGLTTYPTDCGGESQPPCGGVEATADDIYVKFSPDLLEPSESGENAPGRRYPMYIATGGHASCISPAYAPVGTSIRVPNLCAHNLGEGAPFYADNEDWSRILRPGTGTRWTIAEETATNELTYNMSSFIEGFWMTRNDGRVYAGRRTYTPPPESGTTNPTIHPTWLDSDDPGNALRHPPFLAEVDVKRSCGGCSHVGVWFADPAWEIEGHVDFDHTFSTEYCFNPFLGIDIRTTEGCQ